jgi:hypothetical protein
MMNPTKANCRLRVEMLEQREAPATLTVTPPTAHATVHTATIADVACTNGMSAHAGDASNSVVSC